MERTLDIVKTFMAHNQISPKDVPDLIESIYNKIKDLEEGSIPEVKPVINVEDTLQGDYLVCLEDGKKVKLLRRHLKQHYNMTAEEYREKWGLPSDYPMVSKTYAARRSRLAKKQGLGKKAA